ncbi:PIN domain-containing protein [Euzebya tangerina]|uniref:PIN domain-containing protein n=1 Tax=Euzebya tangerina TaxID=591198 RepID=UPI00196AF1F6|nr:PIN domain-containing protein [Euzebya tangerina]
MQFVDTSVLLYVISTDPAEATKSAAARELLTGRDLGLSTQVLGEFYVQATRPSRADRISQDQAVRLVRSFQRFAVQPITAGVVDAAMEAVARHQVSYWDAAIIEAARELGCETVISEDLNAGQSYSGVTVVNSFDAD